DESQDLTQGFFAEILEKDGLKTVDRERGKFRTFLLAALKHYMADQYDHDRAQKRGGGRRVLSLDYESAETEAVGAPASSEPPDQAYRRDWAARVMSQAMEEVRTSYQASGRSGEFDQFKAHLTSVRPAGATYESLAAALGISVGDVRNWIRAA